MEAGWVDGAVVGSRAAVDAGVRLEAGGMRYRVRVTFQGPGVERGSFERWGCPVRAWFDFGFMHWGFWWKRSARSPDGGVCK